MAFALNLTDLRRTSDANVVKAWTERWANSLVTFDEAFNLLSPGWVLETLSVDAVVTDCIGRDRYGMVFRERVAGRAFFLWQMHKRKMIIVEAYEEAIRKVVRESKQNGYQMNQEQAIVFFCRYMYSEANSLVLGLTDKYVRME